MNRTLPLLAASFAGLLVGPAPTPLRADPPGTAPLRVALAVATTDPSPVVVWSVTNESSRAIPIDARDLPAGRLEADLFEVTRDGVPVPYRGRRAPRAVPAAPDLVPIAPGSGFSSRLDLGRDYDFEPPGRYVVRYRAAIVAVVGASFVVAPLVSDAVVIEIPPASREPASQFDQASRAPLSKSSANSRAFSRRTTKTPSVPDTVVWPTRSIAPG